jgi:hypothetical protein
MASPTYFKRLTLLKKLFWLYFLLLIFEGVLRKWVVPQLSGPLLIVRDPIGLMIIWEAYRTRGWPERWSAVISLLTVGLVGLFIVQVIFGNPLIMGLFGLRSYLLPFPVMFIMGENLDDEDLRKFCACILWLLPPMTLLELAQYLLPGSFLNSGAYEGGGQIGFIGGHVRSSGTFSFVSGAESFASLAAAFILYGITSPGFAKRWMLWAGAFAVILSIPTFGSRTVLVQLAGIFVCVAIGATMGLSQFGKLFRLVLPVVVLSFLAAQLPIFSDALHNMTERVTGANTTEGGSEGARGAIVYRAIGQVIDVVELEASSSGWLGRGMGSSANAMYALGKSAAPDNDIAREFVEFGLAVIGYGLFKLFLAIRLLGNALARARDQQPLALLMLPLALTLLLFSTPEQPTGQGFMVMSAAFCIAAARVPAPIVPVVPQLALLRKQVLERRRIQRAHLQRTNALRGGQ